MSRSRRQDQPSRSPRPAARIAAERARRTRGARSQRNERKGGERRVSEHRGSERNSGERKARASSSSRKRRHGPPPERRRLLAIVACMGLLGFATVYIGDGLSKAFASGHFGEYTGAELWDKLKDRLLDRDVPRTGSERSKTPKPRTAPKPVAPAPAVEPEDAKVARADLEAEDPKRYAEESRGLYDERPKPRGAADPRARIDAILEKAGVPPR